MENKSDKSSWAFRIYVIILIPVVFGLVTGIFFPFDLGQDILHLPTSIFVPQTQAYIDFYNYYTVIYFIVAFVIGALAAIISIGTRDWFEVVGLFLVGLLPRERKQWGVVIDQETKQPLAFLPVKVMEQRQDQWVVAAETTTDSDGRYRLAVKGVPGQKYSIQIGANGYKPYTHVLEDYLASGENDIVNDVLLQKEAAVAGEGLMAKIYMQRPHYYRMLFLGIYVLYLMILVVQIFYLVNDPLFGNLLSAVLMMITAIWNTRIVLGRRNVLMGKVVAEPEHKPLTGAEVELILPVGNAKATSDAQGVVRFMAEAGVYRGNVKAPGYTMLGVDSQGFKIIKIGKEGYVSQDMKMQSISTPFVIDPRSVIGTY